MNRLLTPKFEEAIKDYPLYSQDGKARDAVCVAIFTIGNIRWFVLEGGKEGDDTILFMAMYTEIAPTTATTPAMA